MKEYSKKSISPAAPTRSRAIRAGLGKPLLRVEVKYVCPLVIEHFLKHGHQLGRKCLKRFGCWGVVSRGNENSREVQSWAPSYIDLLSWKNVGGKIYRNCDNLFLVLWEPWNILTTASSVTHLLKQQKLGITSVTSGNLERDLPICSNKFTAPVCLLLMTPTLWLTLQKYRIQKGRHQDCHYGPHFAGPAANLLKNYL